MRERCVLTHSCSRYVTAILRHAAAMMHFAVIVVEDAPDGAGHRTAAALLGLGVPVRMLEFGAASRCMHCVDLVVCGAYEVLADGGVVGPIGTLTLAHSAAAHSTPLYVAVPHRVFCHTRHLNSIPRAHVRSVPSASHRRVLAERPRRDATPPQLVGLLLTDVGVLTVSAVADEMLKRQQRLDAADATR